MNRFINGTLVFLLVLIGVITAFVVSVVVSLGLTAIIHWNAPIDRSLAGNIFSVVFLCALLVESEFLISTSSRESSRKGG